MLYFAHGAQLAASRAALRSTPPRRRTRYEWVLELIEAGRFEVTFYLEMSWLYVLHVALETDWDAATVELRKVAPYLDHLAYARELFEADITKSGANERRSLAASPEPEVSPPPSPPPPPAPPCTVEMLRQRPAGDKSWPIACSDTALGSSSKELDLSGAHLSYGDFKDATFVGEGAIKLNGAGLANADLSGSKLTAESSSGEATIDFTKANLANADLRGSTLTVETPYGEATIDFTEANLANADLRDSTLTVESSYGEATIDFTKANLANANLRGSTLKAKGETFDGDAAATIDFTKADLANADLRGAEFTANSSYGEATIDFSEANLANADLRDVKLNAKSIIGLEPPPPPPSPPSLPPSPSPPPSTETIVLTLTASGSLSDYSDTSSLRRGIATAAGVDTSLVTIAVTAGSVLITATIAVPASTTPAAVLTSLVSTLGTAAAASTALGITIEEKPAVTIASPPLPPPPSPSPPQPSLSPLPPPPPPLVTTISLRTKDGGGADLTAAFIGGATAAVTLLVLLFFASRCVPSASRALHQPPAFRDLTRCPHSTITGHN